MMDRSYGFHSNFASKQIFSITHIGEIYYKGLDVPELSFIEQAALADPNS
jgi:hypothetical protein